MICSARMEASLLTSILYVRREGDCPIFKFTRDSRERNPAIRSVLASLVMLGFAALNPTYEERLRCCGCGMKSSRFDVSAT